MVTVDSILQTLEKWVADKQPIDASTWLDACMKLTLLQGEEQNRLFHLEQQLAKEKSRRVENGDSVAKAKSFIETLDSYVEVRKLEAKIDRVTELVRISKIQARMASDMVQQN